MDLNHTPVFRSLWEGSMVGRADPQLVFLFLLGHADPDDRVDIHPSAIAALTGIPIERVIEALRYLEEPDEMSRRADHDGRRIIRLDEHRSWGWTIVNRSFYKNLHSEERRRRQNRDAKQRERQRTSSSVSDGQQPSPQAVGSRQEALGTRHDERDADAPSRALPSRRSRPK